MLTKKQTLLLRLSSVFIIIFLQANIGYAECDPATCGPCAINTGKGGTPTMAGTAICNRGSCFCVDPASASGKPLKHHKKHK